MGSGDQEQLDRAFDRIEQTILPCIGMLIDTLVDASEQRTSIAPSAHAVELRTLALQLEALTREIEAVSPARFDAGVSRKLGSG